MANDKETTQQEKISETCDGSIERAHRLVDAKMLITEALDIDVARVSTVLGGVTIYGLNNVRKETIDKLSNAIRQFLPFFIRQLTTEAIELVDVPATTADWQRWFTAAIADAKATTPTVNMERIG